MRHVFLSYSHDDADFAQILKEQINKAGFATWKDLDLRAGDNWPAEIDEAIKGALAVVLVMSARAKASEYVSFEWAFALGAGVPVLPLLLKAEADELHPRLKSIQALNFSNYQLRPWEALTQRLKEISELDRPFTLRAPRDAPPVVQEAARALDSLNADERNAAIQTLAQMKNPAALDVLAEAMQHPIADVRLAAAIALAKVKDLRALRGLFEAIRNKRFDDLHAAEIDLADFGEAALPVMVSTLLDAKEDQVVRMWAASALSRMNNRGALPALRELLSDTDPDLRKAAVDALSRYDEARPWILECMRDESPWVAGAAIKALARLSGPDFVAALIVALRRPERDVRWDASRALIEVGDATALPALLESLRDTDDNVRTFSAQALARFGDESAVPSLLEAIHDDSHSVRSYSRDALIRLGVAALAGLLESLHSKNRLDRLNAAYALGAIGDPTAVPALLQAVRDEDEYVRGNAVEALGQMKADSAAPNLIAILKNDDEEDDLRQTTSDALKKIGTPEARAAVRAWERSKKRDT
jgi:HEAT repeat protein